MSCAWYFVLTFLTKITNNHTIVYFLLIFLFHIVIRNSLATMSNEVKNHCFAQQHNISRSIVFTCCTSFGAISACSRFIVRMSALRSCTPSMRWDILSYISIYFCIGIFLPTSADRTELKSSIRCSRSRDCQRYTSVCIRYVHTMPYIITRN